MSNPKSIFITGAASGIGRKTALLFANRGWFVGLFDIDKTGLGSLLVEIGEDNCCLKVMNVANVDRVGEAVETFVARTGGKMDVLFNSAGILRMGLNETISLEDQHLIVDINVKGSWYGSSVLFVASRTGNVEMVRFLLENGADVRFGSVDGEFSLESIEAEGNAEILELLKQK